MRLFDQHAKHAAFMRSKRNHGDSVIAASQVGPLVAVAPINHLMTQVAIDSVSALIPSYERCDHAILRGEFPALVFSGDRRSLGELPGEPTAATLLKYAMPDDRLDASRDFARTPHMALPLWAANRVRPFDGVCFVLSDQNHAAIDELLAHGGVHGEHFVIAEQILATSAESRLRDQVVPLQSLDASQTVVLLGYGDQGARIAKILREDCLRDSCSIAVVDGNPDSARRAHEAGHHVIGHPRDLAFVSIIYTPLMRYERLYNLFQEYRSCELAIDNSSTCRNANHFVQHGGIWLEPAAERALAVAGTRLHKRAPQLPIHVIHVVRDDARMLANHRFPHLSGGHREILATPSTLLDCASAPGSGDQYGFQTWQGMRRAFVSLRDRPALPVFAARAFCDELWPRVTAHVFPRAVRAGSRFDPFRTHHQASP